MSAEDGGPEVFYDMKYPGSVERVVRETALSIICWSNLASNGSLFDNDSLRGRRPHVGSDGTDSEGVDWFKDFNRMPLDSHQIIQLVHSLRLSLHNRRLPMNLFFAYGTLTPRPVAALITPPDTYLAIDNGQDERLVSEDLIAAYRGFLRRISHQVSESEDELEPSASRTAASGPVNVVLTGSTGLVGKYLLRALLDRVGIGHIFCLNRAEDGGKSAQHRGFAFSNLSLEGLDDRVTFIKAYIQEPSLRLDKGTYEFLRTQASLFIHAAGRSTSTCRSPSFVHTLPVL